MPDQNVIGAIDIGSNAIRMICARLTEDYRIEELEKNRTPIRLGEDVFRMGYITEERIEQLLATIKVYQKTLEQNNCKEICAYCTSAFRESGNRQTVIERVEMETGIQLESISGGEEAQLLQRAVQRVMDLSKGRIMLADLGGGSLEVTLLEDGEIEFAESFRMGTVRMLKMFPYRPEREKAFLSWAEYYVEDFIDFLKKHPKTLCFSVVSRPAEAQLPIFTGQMKKASKKRQKSIVFFDFSNHAGARVPIFTLKMKNFRFARPAPLSTRKWDFRRRSRPRELAQRSQDDVSLNKLPQNMVAQCTHVLRLGSAVKSSGHEDQKPLQHITATAFMLGNNGS